MNNNKTFNCLGCNKSELEIPLIRLQYNNRERYICSACLPTLIHSINKLSDKLDKE